MPDQITPPTGYTLDQPSQSSGEITPPAGYKLDDAPGASSTSRFFGNIGDSLAGQTRGLVNTVLHPIDTAEGVWQSHVDTAKKAVDAYKQGNYQDAAVHALNALIPLVGPSIDHAATQIQSGDFAGGMGQAVGLGLGLAAPSIAKGVAPAAGAALDAGKAATGSVIDLATDPAVRSFAGVISPRLSHALDLVARFRKATDAYKAAPEGPTAAPPQTTEVSPPAAPPAAEPVATPQATANPKSPQPKALEIIAANRDAKAQRFADALHANGITSKDAASLPMDTFSDQQMQAGRIGWGNIALHLGEKSPSNLSVGLIVQKLREMEKPPVKAATPKLDPRAIAEQLKDEMIRNGTIQK
jgi:hypothetical protein